MERLLPPFLWANRIRCTTCVEILPGILVHVLILAPQCNKLNLLFVGPLHKRKIRALAMYKRFTLTASGPQIYIWKRARLVF